MLHASVLIRLSIIGFFGLSLVTLALLPLGLDEAYYWYWAKHPDLSYFDHPPLLAWIMWASTSLGDDREFFVRIGGFIFLWLGLGFSFATARLLFPHASKIFAWEYLLVLNLTLIIPGASLIQTPDTPLFACWMLALYFGSKVVVKQEGQAWYGLGLAIGLGLLSKYTMVLLVPGLWLFLLLSPTHRHWFGRQEPWLAAILALLIWTPVLLWNAQHDWLSFRFQLQHGLTADGASWLEKLVTYFGGQALIVSPFLWFSFVWYSLKGSGKNARTPVYLFLLSTSWPIILFFAWTSLRGNQAEANWPAPAYLSGLLLSWAILRGHMATRSNRLVAKSVLLISLILSLTLRTHLLVPWLPIPPKHDRLQEFAGWPALGRQIKTIIDAHPHPAGWLLLGDRGTTLAEALYYTSRYTKQPLLGFDPQRPERYLFLQDFNAQFRGKNAIIMVRQPLAVAERFGRFFQRLTPIEPPYKHQYRGQTIPRFGINLYLGENFQNWE